MIASSNVKRRVVVPFSACISASRREDVRDPSR
jgi:hypothetical protein